MQCNDAQKGAILHDRGPMLVSAGPGSGKTFVISHRIQNLIENLGVSSDKILVITFTKSAALEMKNRIKNLIGTKADQLVVGTFHSAFFQILRSTIKYRNYTIIKNRDKNLLLREILENFGIETRELKEMTGKIAADISHFKNNMELSFFEQNDFAKMYKYYEQRLSQMRVFDFDDLLSKTFDLLSADLQVLNIWKKHFQYILIDEFQDINQLQYQIVQLLAGNENPNLFVVGDDDQSIYAFRGAKPGIMIHFQEDYPNAKQILLNYNYRCAIRILNQSLNLISYNQERILKDILASKEENGSINFHFCKDRTEEEMMLLTFFHDHPEVIGKSAILGRTKEGIGAIAEFLRNHGVQVQLTEESKNIYDHFIAMDLIHYLMFVNGDHRRKVFYQFLNRPFRNMSRNCAEDEIVSMEKVIEWHARREYHNEQAIRLKNDLEFLGKLSPYAAIHYILYGMKYLSFIHEFASENHMKESELLEIALEILERSRQYKTQEEWLAFVTSQEDLEEQKNQKEQKENKERKLNSVVTLSTMHASKGLEYENVFIIDAIEGITPYKKALTQQEIEEERRLFYVAMTRAKEALHIITLQNYHEKGQRISRFLGELEKPYSSSSDESSSNSSSSKNSSNASATFS